MKLYKCRLTRIESIHNNLRTDEIVGLTEKLPTKGEPFTIESDALFPVPHISQLDQYRLISTTVVLDINFQNKNELLFRTANSKYFLEVLARVEGNLRHLSLSNNIFLLKKDFD